MVISTSCSRARRSTSCVSSGLAKRASATVADLSSRTARMPVAIVDGEWIEVSVWVDVPPIAPFLPRTAVRSVREPLERYRYEDER